MSAFFKTTYSILSMVRGIGRYLSKKFAWLPIQKGCYTGREFHEGLRHNIPAHLSGGPNWVVGHFRWTKTSAWSHWWVEYHTSKRRFHRLAYYPVFQHCFSETRVSIDFKLKLTDILCRSVSSFYVFYIPTCLCFIYKNVINTYFKKNIVEHETFILYAWQLFLTIYINTIFQTNKVLMFLFISFQSPVVSACYTFVFVSFVVWDQ